MTFERGSDRIFLVNMRIYMYVARGQKSIKEIGKFKLKTKKIMSIKSDKNLNNTYIAFMYRYNKSVFL